MVRDLVISDSHQRPTRILKIREQAGPVRHTYYLGDYWDNYSEYPNSDIETAEYLLAHADDPKHIFLLGNHDLGYMYPLVGGLRCSGYDEFKLRRVVGNPKTSNVFEVMRSSFQFSVMAQGWTLSHAGWTGDLALWLKELTLLQINQKIKEALNGGQMHPLLRVGYARGGKHATGGITWCDWQHEFQPVEGMKQIVGHTRGKQPRWNGQNLCLDTQLDHYAIIEDGNVTIHEVNHNE